MEKIRRKFSEETKLKMSKSHLGKPRPDYVKKLISATLTGKKPSIETRLKLSEKKRGSNNHNWKGGLTPIHEKLRNCLEYRLWRQSVLKRDNFTCRFYFKVGGKLHADHIKPFAYFPELRFAIDNGRILCVECHRKTDTYGSKSKLSNLKTG